MSAQQNKKRGYEFENEVIRGLELVKDLIVYKIPDAKTFGHLMTWSVPADIMFGYGGEIFTIECKQTKLARIPWANFKEHQILWGEAVTKGYFIINFNDREKTNRTFLIPGAALSALKRITNASVPIDLLASVSTELERKTKRFHPDKKGAFIDFSTVKW